MVLDTIIIGAGAMGSAAAYWLSKYQDVALVEQFDFLHDRGSSHGQSRVTRKTYRQDYFAEMMKTSYQLWDDIQTETQISVFQKTGGLDVGQQGNEDLAQTHNICEATELPYELLDYKELMNRHPAYCVDDDYYAIYQPDTGILNATKAVNMFQQRAARQGAQLQQHTPVTSIHPYENYIVVDTPQGSYRGKNLVITAGTWINMLLDQFDLQVQVDIWKLTFAYWRVTKPEYFSPERFPVFIHWAENDDYGFPISERPGYVKIAPHFNDLIDKTPEKDGINPVNTTLLDHLSDFIGSTFQGVSTTPEFAETCLYTMTQDENFIIDSLPDHDNIIVAGGFSGHGFKFTPLIGKLIQQMVMHEDLSHDLSPFALKHVIR